MSNQEVHYMIIGTNIGYSGEEQFKKFEAILDPAAQQFGCLISSEKDNEYCIMGFVLLREAFDFEVNEFSFEQIETYKEHVREWFKKYGITKEPGLFMMTHFN